MPGIKNELWTSSLLPITSRDSFLFLLLEVVNLESDDRDSPGTIPCFQIIEIFETKAESPRWIWAPNNIQLCSGFATVQRLRVRVSCLDTPCGSARSLPFSSFFSHLLCTHSDDLPYLLRKIYRLKKITLLRRKNGLMQIRGTEAFSITLLTAINNKIVSSNLR